MQDEVRLTIRSFIDKSFGQNRVADSDDIFASGLVNSLFAMQLVAFVEQKFNITVENEDLDLDNFRSIDALSAFVIRKLGDA